MRFILVLLYLISNTFWSNAQNHVNWEFSYDKLSSSVLIKGTIDEGWHLYSQKTPANSGPIPVTITFLKNKGLKLIGNCEEKLDPHDIFDENFDSKVYLFENSCLSCQKIRLKNLYKLNGSVNYMVCDKSRCLPPIEVPFTIIIN